VAWGLGKPGEPINQRCLVHPECFVDLAGAKVGMFGRISCYQDSMQHHWFCASATHVKAGGGIPCRRRHITEGWKYARQ